MYSENDPYADIKDKFYQQHLYAINHMKPTIETAQPIPAALRHSKAEMNRKFRQEEIDKRNYQHQQRLLSIMSENRYVFDKNINISPRSMAARKYRIEMINKENEMLMQNIQHQRAILNREDWAKHQEDHNRIHYLRSIHKRNLIENNKPQIKSPRRKPSTNKSYNNIVLPPLKPVAASEPSSARYYNPMEPILKPLHEEISTVILPEQPTTNHSIEQYIETSYEEHVVHEPLNYGLHDKIVNNIELENYENYEIHEPPPREE